MINIDGSIFAKKDIWLDLRNGLPFPNETVAFAYSCHAIEHLLPDDAIAVLKEIRRVLIPSGRARIVVPSFEHALEIATGAAHSEWPRKFRSPTAQALNYLFCDGQHAYAYSFGLMEEFVEQAGFSSILHFEILRSGPFRACIGGLIRLPEEPVGSLVVELRR